MPNITLLNGNKLNFQKKVTGMEVAEKIGKSIAKKSLNYNDLLKSCDIGLSTVIFHKKLLKIAYFPIIKTKEDYALWLSFARNNIHIAGINKYYSSWRKNY